MELSRLADRIAFDFGDAFIQRVDVRPKQAAGADFTLGGKLGERLTQIGVQQLYSHQVQALNLTRKGEDIVVVTGTNSGKTLCYNLPVIERLLEEPNAHALYLYPTKALARDQLGKLEELSDGLDICCGAYDGDTPRSKRSPIRKNAQILLSNPDMLHVGILPQFETWLKFIRSLRFVVLDEIHAYRGVFGSHVGGVLRRLLRICEWQNCHPQIIACSATIANPSEHFEVLTGRMPVTVDQDGAPQGKKVFLFLSSAAGGEDAVSPNMMASNLLADFISEKKRSLAFCRSRVGVELVLRQTRRKLEGRGLDPKLVESYRAGYKPEERRKLEKGLFEGRFLGLATTNAMELGVDVGGLDTVILNGYPGSLASFFQQAGRAGRGERSGLAVMIAREDPLEQFIARCPELLFDRSVESVSAYPSNPHVLRQQLLCAAYERPLGPDELERWGSGALQIAEELVQSGELQLRAGRYYYPSHESPSVHVDIRSLSGPTINLRCGGDSLGTAEYWRAIQSLHAGAVYLHRGRSFVVEALDLDRKEAVLAEGEPDYYTRTVVQSLVEPKVQIEAVDRGGARIQLSSIDVAQLILGYQEVSLADDCRSDLIPLELPSLSYGSIGVRISVPITVDDELAEPVGAKLHALEHALLAVAPIFAGCDRSDLGSSWYLDDGRSGGPGVVLFDAVPGGVGLAEKLYTGFDMWCESALALLAGCACHSGCPLCLFGSRCEISNELLDKAGAIDLLKSLTGKNSVV